MLNKFKFKNVGVIGFGAHVPTYRITVDEIAKVHEKDGRAIAASLGVKEKAVADRDEDTVSLAAAAALHSLKRVQGKLFKPKDLGAVLVGSESHPYAVKPTGSVVAEILGVGREYLTADLEFACKAGTTAMIVIASLIEAGLIEAGLAIGADVAQSRRGDALEYTAGAGAAAVVLGSKKYPWQAKFEAASSFNSDTPDFWRRAGQKFPAHAGRFTGEPAYFAHVEEGTRQFLKKFRQKIGWFNHVVLHMPNGKFPKKAAARLGVTAGQLKTGFIVEKIGNPYCASAMTGLVKVLEEGRKNQKILMTSYGSGAGSDSISLTILQKNSIGKDTDVSEQIKKFEYISYSKLC
ncbi:TPA: hydroxymethylglutaryl-CoA synthase [Candidatus Beckwithbacteria bacterium]|nr:MAG: hydroxymethylglutaryl-CoA synthase [Candidatus Beckwithbacteria bacterium GW2011_GWC1_49_16]KKU34849.1 MAG: hypothetical protein UX50_C0010G0018 [Candidatus Beckwithbacteria bacterium GW2011_GWA1_46_30]KKU72685.1 MAG: hypothetical protein UX97_C0001G0555 [Candidatus Beckwithbacteria bacterium GW2011_GWA2_47_25]OGD65779.1 MAG: hypothetical protein A2584_03800 [Candidatus Beckwithbacteria bacterium RIFOXYD1_FULL_50_11]HAV66150.1 hydroxymethylglutaryl-CoA synthase [Candidatus Beckwithbacte